MSLCTISASKKTYFAPRQSPKISPNSAHYTKSDTPTSPNTAPATKNYTPTLLFSTLLSTLFFSTLLCPLLYISLLYSTLLYSCLVYSTLLYDSLLFCCLLSTLVYDSLSLKNSVTRKFLIQTPFDQVAFAQDKSPSSLFVMDTMSC